MNEATKGQNAGTPAKILLASIDREKYTVKGLEALSQRVDSYIEDLADESAKISRRYQADLISAVHVEKAAEHLLSGSASKAYRHAGTIGGILLGVGLSTMVSVVLANNVTVTGLILSCSFSVIGTLLVALHIAKD